MRASSSITSDPLDAAAIALIEASVEADECGAVLIFRGVVRDNDSDQAVTGLDYEAHPQASEFLARCCEDVALVAAVSSGHRAEGFAACAALVERIKAEVPIWKRQHFTDGVSEWVGL